MTTRNITIPDNMYEQLKKLADKSGVSIAAIIKMACSEYIEKNQTTLKEYLSKLEHPLNSDM